VRGRSSMPTAAYVHFWQHWEKPTWRGLRGIPVSARCCTWKWSGYPRQPYNLWYIGTWTKYLYLMSSLLVFNRVYWLEIQSVMLVFSTPLVNYRLSNLLTGSPTPPPPSCVNKYSAGIYWPSFRENKLFFRENWVYKFMHGVCIHVVCNRGWRG
jgi:hypothetical protein